jgi:hypothetical protein
VQPPGGHGLCGGGDHAEDREHDEGVADGGGHGLPGGLRPLGLPHPPALFGETAAPLGQPAEGEQLGRGVGVEELQRLHVGHRGGGQIPAAPAGHAGGRAAGEPVEDPYPQLGQHPVSQVVREVHLAPGHQGAYEDEGGQSGDRTG